MREIILALGLGPVLSLAPSFENGSCLASKLTLAVEGWLSNRIER